MNYQGVIIETKRLRLVPISPKFRKDIFASFTEQVARYTFPQPAGDIRGVDNFISSSLEGMIHGEQLQFVAVLKDTDEFIGCMGLHHIQTRPEPGLWLKESVWGNGFGFEVVEALKRWADENIEYEYLYYPVNRDNIASRRIPEKLGGILEKHEFMSKNARGESYVTVAYRIYF